MGFCDTQCPEVPWAFDREIHFYNILVSILGYLQAMWKAGMNCLVNL